MYFGAVGCGILAAPLQSALYETTTFEWADGCARCIVAPMRTRLTLFDENAATCDGLDCIIVGHNDVNFNTLAQRARATARQSAFYEDIKLNSVLIDGQRLSYLDLLNRALTQATGAMHALSPFRQPHLGVCYLSSFLRKRGLTTREVNSFDHDKDRFRTLLAESPRAVAITTTFYVDPEPIIEIVRFVREASPDTKIILGGPFVFSTCAKFDATEQDYFFGLIGADIHIVDSQGESTLAAVLRQLQHREKADLSRVPNLIYTTDGKSFNRTPRAIENNDIEANTIEWSYFDRDYVQPTVYMRTARSCPFACSFCSYPSLGGEHVTVEIGGIMTQLRQLRDLGVQNVVFIDDTFNVPLPRFKKLLRAIIADRLDLRWMSFFRCSNADDEAFDLMQKSGCAGAFIGVESGDERMLKEMNKFASVERYRYGIRALEDRGIFAFASLVVGFPGETERSVKNTMEMLDSARPSFFAPQIYVHDQLAPVQARAKELKISGGPLSWSHYSMNWREATAWVQTLCREVNNSDLVGGWSLSCWGMFYLLTQGYSMAQLRTFLRTTRRMVIDGFDEREGIGFDELVALFKNGNVLGRA